MSPVSYTHLGAAAVGKGARVAAVSQIGEIIFICNRYGVTMDGLFKEEVPTPGEPPVEAPLLSARTLGSELSNLYANLSP